jgi:outer membrane protein OmpA-like peptidoglycan-associated protein
MHISFRSSVFAVLMACTALTSQASETGGYWSASSGDVVRSTDQSCWRSGSWTPAHANAFCDSHLLPPPTPIAVQSVGTEVPTPAPAYFPSAPTVSVERTAPANPTLLDVSIFFDFGKSRLKPNQLKALRDLTQPLQHHNSAIYIVGHTDPLGSVALNRSLGQARADAVAKALISFGIERDRIETIGAGSEDLPTATAKCGHKATHRTIECFTPARRARLIAR